MSKPLTGLRGTHVAGGSVVWIVGDLEHMTARGFRPLGMEPLAVGVSSDADHIITPSKEGPTTAIRQALAEARIRPEEIASWDLHATATPGDFQEVENLRDILPEHVLVTARKGTFGHGMGAGGGWELTAQYLGYQKRAHLPDAARRDRAQPGDRARARALRLRPGLRGARGHRRQALDGRRRHQRLRDLAPARLLTARAGLVFVHSHPPISPRRFP